MAKSFLGSMANAAARQIGRDTARVITNSMYGDAHATPHRVVNSQVEVDLSRHWQQINSDELAELTASNINEWCSQYGCTYIKVGDNSINWFKSVCCIVLCMFLNWVGAIILAYRAYVHYKHEKHNHERYIIEHPFIEEYTVIDNRVRSGFKTNKRQNVEYFEIPTYSESFNDWCKKEIKMSKIYIAPVVIGICIFICTLILGSLH